MLTVSPTDAFRPALDTDWTAASLPTQERFRAAMGKAGDEWARLIADAEKLLRCVGG
jgi:hypothetical protein